MKLSVYRYNPETDAKPYMQDFDVALPQTDNDAAAKSVASAKRAG